MTIRKGEPWGSESFVPDGTATIVTDAQLAGTQDPVIVAGGDVWDALGRPEPREAGQRCTCVDLDAMECVVDLGGTTRLIRAASHVTVMSCGGLGRFTCVSNVGLVRGLRLAPRAHPNDGLLHVVEVDRSMPVVQRVIAHRRSRTGSHVPHPSIHVSSCANFLIDREGRDRLVIDGNRVKGWKSVAVRIMPDAIRVLI